MIIFFELMVEIGGFSIVKVGGLVSEVRVRI